MAESGAFKTLNDKDVVSTRTLLHEAIPITGTIVSGTYSDNNIKNPSHGMFQSVFDYPFLSSSANHIFDITVGISANSSLYSSVTSQKEKKKNIYNQMAQLLVGYDHTGSIQRFDEDGNIVGGGTKLDNVFIMPFSRLLVKDEIKKGTFELEFGVDTAHTTTKTKSDRIKITDFSGSDGYFVNSPVGEYGVLYATSSNGACLQENKRYAVGLLYYQAGIAVISGSIFNKASSGGILANAAPGTVGLVPNASATGFFAATASTTQILATGIRSRLYNVQFNNTTELNSTIYFCRANHQEFNYSTNPTYTNASKIRVKTNSTDEPVSYITTIGLYNDKNELMATAKLSEPLKKTPSTEFTIRCRLDY
jgi:hypothetical protein